MPTKLKESRIFKTLIVFLSFSFTLFGFSLVSTSEASAAAPKSVTVSQVTRSRSALSLSWSSVAGASSYRVKYSTSSKMSKAKIKTASSNRIELSGLGSHKAYYVQVRGLNSSGGTVNSYGKAKKFWTLSKGSYGLLPPTNISATTVNDTSIRLSFSARAGASKYRVQYGPSSSRITGKIVLNSNSAIIPGLPSGSKFYFSVKALSSNEGSLSYYSGFTSGTTATAYKSLITTNSGYTNELKVSSYNIRCYGCNNPSIGELSWEQRAEAVTANILSQKPDVIGLQEDSQSLLTGSTYTQYMDLISKMGDPYRLTNSYRYNCKVNTSSVDCSYQNLGAGLSDRIAYNAETIKFIRGGSKLLSKHKVSDSTRYFAWAELEQLSTGKHFIFGTVHLQVSPAGYTSADYASGYYELRATQSREAADEITRVNTSKLPVVMTGDMNTRWNTKGSDGSYSNPQYDIFTGLGLYDPLNNGTAADRLIGPVKTLRNIIHGNYYSFNGSARYQQRATKPGAIGTNIDDIYLSKSITALEWETVVNVDSNGNFIGIIPSDHNMLSAKIRF